MKLTIAFLSSRFSTQPKSYNKNVNISRTKRAFKIRQKTFSIILKGSQLLYIVLDPRAAFNVFLHHLIELTLNKEFNASITAWKVSKHGVFSGLYFPVFGLFTQCTKYVEYWIYKHWNFQAWDFHQIKIRSKFWP